MVNPDETEDPFERIIRFIPIRAWGPIADI